MLGETAPSAARFVGRTDELRVVDHVCALAAEGHGTLVLVSGEAGVGKSRLCEEVATRARRRGLRVVTARCWDEGGAPPLWPWQPILRELCDEATADLLAADGDHDPDARIDPDRFARFVAVIERLTAACAREPACLVVDDIQAADPGTLLLVRFVARALPGLALSIVLTRRTSPSSDADPPRLLEDIERDATVSMRLRPFDLAETTEFLDAQYGRPCEPDLITALLRVTGGNPLFLRRITALGTLDSPVEDRLPAGLRVAIDAAVDGMRPTTRRVLETSAVLGRTPTLGETAALTGMGLPDVLDALGEAASLGLIGVGPTERFAFTHELVRAALEDRLPVQERLDAHDAAASLVADADTPEALARHANHLLRVAPRSSDDARLAVESCRVAARSMIGRFAYEQAEALLSAAVALHLPPLLGAPTAPLLVDWAEAALLCGRLADARVRFDRAAEVAEKAGDPVVFAEAALGMGGVWVAERRSPVTRTRVLAQQRAALAGLPDDEVARRCRLRARLAAEAVYDGGRQEAVLAALEDARRSGDARALAEALSLTHHTILSPEHAVTRLGLADELIKVASEAGLGVLSLMGLCWRAVDLFLLGDPRAVRALEELRERADALNSENVLYIVDVIDVMLLIRAGRLDEAEAAAAECHTRGTDVGDLDAFGYLGAHTLVIRWIQGREAELTDLADEVAESPTLVSVEFAFKATAAAVAAAAGRTDHARARLDHVVAGGLAALPPSSTWFTGIFTIVEAAARLGDADLARQAHDVLLPYADLPVMPSLAVACLGSARRALGVAALTYGDVDRAIDQFERALDGNRRLGHRPLVAIIKAELAHALAVRGGEHDLALADELYADALDEAEQMGMTGRITPWRSQQAQVAARRAGAVAAVPVRGIIRREGHGWMVGLGDRRVLVGDLVGMAYLAELLTHPGVSIPAAVLAAGDPARTGPPTSLQETVDDEARAAYLDEARDLAEELSEAESDNDLDRAAKLRADLDFLLEHIEAATGLGGRARTFVGDGERARTAVRKAIMRAIEHVGEAHPELGAHLRATVTTGTACSYTGDPRLAVRWSTHPD